MLGRVYLIQGEMKNFENYANVFNDNGKYKIRENKGLKKERVI